jgi:hypothetical protein
VEGGGEEAEAEAALRNAADEDEAWRDQRELSESEAESAGEEEVEDVGGAAQETPHEGGRGRGRGRAAGRGGAKRKSKKKGAAASNRYVYGTKHSKLIASVMRRMNQFGARVAKWENPTPSDAFAALQAPHSERFFFGRSALTGTSQIRCRAGSSCFFGVGLRAHLLSLS